MNPRSKGLGVFAAVLLAQVATGEPPDLGGRWMLIVEDAGPAEDAPPPRIPATAGSGWGREITITRQSGRVTIERHQFSEYDLQPPMRYVYALDGAESANVVNLGRGPQEEIARAEWKSETLVIVSRHSAGTDLAAEVTQVFSLDGSGAMVVETKRTAAGVASRTTARYARQPLPGSEGGPTSRR